MIAPAAARGGRSPPSSIAMIRRWVSGTTGGVALYGPSSTRLRATEPVQAAAAPRATGAEGRAEAAEAVLHRLGPLGDDDRLAEDRLRGGQVFLQEQRRQREYVAVVVETITDVVVGEVGGELEVDADQV